MTNKKEKLKRYLEIEANPSAALFKAIQEFEKKADEIIQDEVDKMRVEIKKMTEEMKTKLQDEPIDMLLKKVVIRAKQGPAGPEGKQGPKPTKKELRELILPLIPSPLPPKEGKPGEEGKDGYTPVPGKDYPTREQIYNMIKTSVARIKIPTPKDGKTPDIKPLVNELTNNFNKQLDLFKKEFEKIKEELKKEKAMLLGGRTIHRGGVKLYVGHSIGTGDGSTTAFTLPARPYSTSEVMATVGGSADYDFTISGTTITFTTPPDTGASVRATYQAS